MVIHHSEKLNFALKVVEAANTGFIDCLYCKSFTCRLANAFSYRSVVAGANNLRADLVILEDIRVLASDEKVTAVADSIERLNCP